MARNCIIRWGAYIALATGLIFGSASNASASACFERLRAKTNVLRGWEYVAKLKATGDCSYVEKIIEDSRRFTAIWRANPCKNVVETMHLTANQVRAKYMRYCKKSPETPRQEIAKVQQIPRQKTAKVQPETRPSKPSTQMPAPVNEKQGRPLPAEAGARHLRPASVEAVPERSGTAPADASALPERPTSPGPSNAQNQAHLDVFRDLRRQPLSTF
jgi:hypothetical protein